jgi:hypothetical protein
MSLLALTAPSCRDIKAGSWMLTAAPEWTPLQSMYRCSGRRLLSRIGSACKCAHRPHIVHDHDEVASALNRGPASLSQWHNMASCGRFRNSPAAQQTEAGCSRITAKYPAFECIGAPVTASAAAASMSAEAHREVVVLSTGETRSVLQGKPQIWQAWGAAK